MISCDSEFHNLISYEKKKKSSFELPLNFNGMEMKIFNLVSSKVSQQWLFGSI